MGKTFWEEEGVGRRRKEESGWGRPREERVEKVGGLEKGRSEGVIVFRIYVFINVINLFWLIRFSFGPQHPASHGVLVCILFMVGEFIVFIDVQIGYLHRGTEKLIEFKSAPCILPYFDRLDYVSVTHNEHVSVLCLEYLLLLSMLARVSCHRMLLLELTRLINGFLAVSCSVLDLGSMSPLLWSFEERDRLLSIFDLICGVRMHVAYMTIGGVTDDIFILYDTIYSSLETSLLVCECFDLLFSLNRIVYLRLRGVALLDWSDLCFNSLSGILLRSTGFCWDLRFIFVYELYRLFDYNFVFGIYGDSYDRFNLRIFELKQSLLLCKQLMCSFLFFDLLLFGGYFVMEGCIESIIYLFHVVWFFCLLGVSCIVVESPKGEYGCFCFVFSRGFVRCRIRCCDYVHVLMLDFFKGFMLCDLVGLIGNVDVVFGSVDR